MSWTNFTGYADFYYTQKHLEAGRNRIINGCLGTDSNRLTPHETQQIRIFTTQIYDKMFVRGKEVLNDFIAKFETHQKTSDATDFQKLAAAAKELNKYNRLAMIVVFAFSEYIIEHPVIPDDGAPLPIPNINAPLDCKSFLQRLKDTLTNLS